MCIIRSVTRLLIDNNKISKTESGFPISSENLIFYISHLRRRVLNEKISDKSVHDYLSQVKSYHRKQNLFLDAFNDQKFINFWKSQLRNRRNKAGSRRDSFCSFIEDADVQVEFSSSHSSSSKKVVVEDEERYDTVLSKAQMKLLLF